MEYRCRTGCRTTRTRFLYTPCTTETIVQLQLRTQMALLTARDKSHCSLTSPFKWSILQFFYIRFTLLNASSFIFLRRIPLHSLFFISMRSDLFFQSFQITMNREELLALVKQKDDIEQELKDLASELKLQGNVGMTEELVDREGYPRWIFLVAEEQGNWLKQSLSLFVETTSILFEYGRFVSEWSVCKTIIKRWWNKSKRVWYKFIKRIPMTPRLRRMQQRSRPAILVWAIKNRFFESTLSAVSHLLKQPVFMSVISFAASERYGKITSARCKT